MRVNELMGYGDPRDQEGFDDELFIDLDTADRASCDRDRAATELEADLGFDAEGWSRLAASKLNLARLTEAEYQATIDAACRIQAEAFKTGEPQKVAAAFLAAREARKR